MEQIMSLINDIGIMAPTWQQLVMFLIGGILIWLAIKKQYEPMLLLPIGFGAILANIPNSAIIGDHGFLTKMYEIGIKYGLDINYVDSFNNSFVAYLLSVSPFKIIDELYEILLVSENLSEWEKNLKILEYRTFYSDLFLTNFEDKIYKNIICQRYDIKNCKNYKVRIDGNVDYLPNWNYYDYYTNYSSYVIDEKKNKKIYNKIKKRIKELSK